MIVFLSASVSTLLISSLFFLLHSFFSPQFFVFRLQLLFIWFWPFPLCFSASHSASAELTSSCSVLELSRWFHFIAQKKTRQWARHVISQITLTLSEKNKTKKNKKRQSLHDKNRKKVSTRTGKHTILMLTGSVRPYHGKRIAVGAFFCTNRPDDRTRI